MNVNWADSLVAILGGSPKVRIAATGLKSGINPPIAWPVAIISGNVWRYGLKVVMVDDNWVGFERFVYAKGCSR